MVTALFVLVAALAAVVALQWWQIHDLNRHLKLARTGWATTRDVCESYLRMLRAVGLVNSVDTCERRPR